jgi:hypothetical protein
MNNPADRRRNAPDEILGGSDTILTIICTREQNIVTSAAVWYKRIREFAMINVRAGATGQRHHAFEAGRVCAG